MLTVQAVDTHHQVNAVIKLFVIFLRREIGKIRCQSRKVAVQGSLEAQLFEKLLFCFVETGGGEMCVSQNFRPESSFSCEFISFALMSRMD